jgi:hypothetical protein
MGEIFSAFQLAIPPKHTARKVSGSKIFGINKILQHPANANAKLILVLAQR